MVCRVMASQSSIIWQELARVSVGYSSTWKWYTSEYFFFLFFFSFLIIFWPDRWIGSQSWFVNRKNVVLWLWVWNFDLRKSPGKHINSFCLFLFSFSNYNLFYLRQAVLGNKTIKCVDFVFSLMPCQSGYWMFKKKPPSNMNFVIFAFSKMGSTPLPSNYTK